MSKQQQDNDDGDDEDGMEVVVDEDDVMPAPTPKTTKKRQRKRKASNQNDLLEDDDEDDEESSQAVLSKPKKTTTTTTTQRRTAPVRKPSKVMKLEYSRNQVPRNAFRAVFKDAKQLKKIVQLISHDVTKEINMDVSRDGITMRCLAEGGGMFFQVKIFAAKLDFFACDTDGMAFGITTKEFASAMNNFEPNFPLVLDGMMRIVQSTENNRREDVKGQIMVRGCGKGAAYGLHSTSFAKISCAEIDAADPQMDQVAAIQWFNGFTIPAKPMYDTLKGWQADGCDSLALRCARDQVSLVSETNTRKFSCDFKCDESGLLTIHFPDNREGSLKAVTSEFAIKYLLIACLWHSVAKFAEFTFTQVEDETDDSALRVKFSEYDIVDEEANSGNDNDNDDDNDENHDPGLADARKGTLLFEVMFIIAPKVRDSNQ